MQDWEWLLTDAIIYDVWNTARSALGVMILAYVIMPNHYHAIFWAEDGQQISNFIRMIQSQTAQRIRRDGGLWKERICGILKRTSDIRHKGGLPYGSA